MLLSRILLPTLILALCLGAFTTVSNQVWQQHTPFPMNTGAYWLYRGTTVWMSENGTVERRTITFKMEVTKTIARDNYFIACIKGHPFDLALCQGRPQRNDYLLVMKNSDELYLLHDDLRREALARLKAKHAKLDDLLTPVDLFLALPLAPEKKYGDPYMVSRDDDMCCWHVDEEWQHMLSNIIGASHRPYTGYRISYRTVPDEQIMDIVPGIGITTYRYLHHGSVSETSVRLTAFYPGK